ncbi:hypothetical protein BPC006_I0507 [Burkholderia pseudomallei BPC006]|nr:hypothetical protein BPC006_I0507 [Burkholderia pseudomallei BPC006]
MCVPVSCSSRRPRRGPGRERSLPLFTARRLTT